MTIASESTHWASEVELEVRRMQPRWPRAVPLGKATSTSFQLPFDALNAFPAVSDEALARFAVGYERLVDSAILQERIFDGMDRSAAVVMRAVAKETEASQHFRSLFPSDAGFWPRLRTYLAEYAWAYTQELGYITGEFPYTTYDEALGLRIARGKNGLSRTVVAGLVELSRDDCPLGALLRILDDFSVATQLWDDLQDWRKDLRRGRLSLLLSRVVKRFPEGLDDTGWRRLEAHLARRMYYEGHASHVLGIALCALDSAEDTSSRLPGFNINPRLVELRQRLEALDQDLESVIAKHLWRGFP